MKGAVLALGALATTVAAVIALVPKSPPISTVGADFSGITVDPDTSLDQYEARYAALPAQAGTHADLSSSRARWRYRLVDFTMSTSGGTTSALTQTGPTSSTEGTPTTSTERTPTTSTEGTPTTSTGGAATTTMQQSTTSTPTTPTAPGKLGRAIHSIHSLPRSEIGAVAGLVSTMTVPMSVPGSERPFDAVVNLGSTATTTTCGTALDAQRCPAAPEIEHELQRGVPPDVAARQVAKIFANSRSEIINHEVHPVGVTVHFSLRLIGFQNKVATLMWSLFPASAAQPLPQEWFRSVIAMQFKAEVPNDSFDGQFWMPEPKAGGRYIVDLTVVDNQGIARGDVRSNPFP